MKRLLGLGFVLASTLACASAIAAEKETKAEPGNEEAMRVYVDPETGTLTSRMPEGMQPPAVERNMHLIEQIEHPNGMTEWQFHGQANEAIVATVKENGKIETICTDHVGHAPHAHAAKPEESRDE